MRGDERGEVKSAIERSRPALLIPCDDRAVGILHALHAQTGPGPLAQLIETSLGDPKGFSAIANKSQLLVVAKSLGLPTPASSPVATEQDLDRAATAIGYPHVLKRDRTWSGKGVRIVRDQAQSRDAWRQLSRRPTPFVALKLALFEGVRVLRERLVNAPAQIDCQEFIPGSPANCAAVFDQGKLLAIICVVVRETIFGETGPSSVVRIINHPDMIQAATALGHHLRLSGFCGFDFVISHADDRAYLLEANPRVTPIASLALADGTHLPQAFYKAWTGLAGGTPANLVRGDLVAFFPDEWQRDPKSAYLHEAHHDVPWDEPALVRLGMRRVLERRLANKVKALTKALARKRAERPR